MRTHSDHPNYQYYTDDIESESDDVFENRLISEMVEEGILTENDFDNWGEEHPTLKDSVDIDSKKYEFIEKCCDQDAFEWYKNNFGISTLADLYRRGQGPSVDMDAIVDECISQDGIAHFIAYYDGDEMDLGNGLYAYRLN